MRLRRTHRLMACSLLAVYLLGGKVAAQQANAGSALTSSANPGAENVRANEVKPALCDLEMAYGRETPTGAPSVCCVKEE